MYIETAASKFIKEGDLAVIETGDDHVAYYLLKLMSTPYETKCESAQTTAVMAGNGTF